MSPPTSSAFTPGWPTRGRRLKSPLELYAKSPERRLQSSSPTRSGFELRTPGTSLAPSCQERTRLNCCWSCGMPPSARLRTATV
uniref:Uncharacterized protein n=1 Tax=Macrostomum lignano TaxID=282301 RepID=A0A1I8FIY9_9PLAT